VHGPDRFWRHSRPVAKSRLFSGSCNTFCKLPGIKVYFTTGPYWRQNRYRPYTWK